MQPENKKKRRNTAMGTPPHRQFDRLVYQLQIIDKHQTLRRAGEVVTKARACADDNHVCRYLACCAIVQWQGKLHPAIGRLRKNHLANANDTLSTLIEVGRLILRINNNGAIGATTILLGSPVTYGNHNLTLVIVALL